MKFTKMQIPGCYLINPKIAKDRRGTFIKILHKSSYREFDIDFEIAEIYYSWSSQNVFRGLHFQLPPQDHAKIVFCPVGCIVDFVLDLRKGSKYFGKVQSFELDSQNCEAIYIPKGCAHGFYSPSERSMVTYLVETEYYTEYDTGIFWSSVDLGYNINNPIISERDRKFPNFSEFNSPFII